MRIMYDSIMPSNIPRDAQMVAGYVKPHRYAWKDSDWAMFPSAVKVRISIFAWLNDGHVLDIETGAAAPAEAPAWVKMRRNAGIDPTVYCSLSLWPAVRAAFIANKVPEPHYWIAAYPGNGPNLYPGSVAHQYADPGPFDISVVADYWPGIDPIPTMPLPAPPTQEETEMPPRYYRQAGKTAVWKDCGDCRRWVGAAEFAALGNPHYDDIPSSEPFWTLPVAGATTDL